MAAPKKIAPAKTLDGPTVPAGYTITRAGTTYTVQDTRGTTHSGYASVEAALDRCAALQWYIARSAIIDDPKVSPAVRAVAMATPLGKPLPVVK